MVERYLAEGLWPNDTMVSALRRLAFERGGDLAVSDAHRRPTWDEIERESCRVGAFLRSLGLKRGELVMIQLPNCVENVILRFALKRVGLLGVYIPVVWREAEMQRVV